MDRVYSILGRTPRPREEDPAPHDRTDTNGQDLREPEEHEGRWDHPGSPDQPHERLTTQGRPAFGRGQPVPATPARARQVTFLDDHAAAAASGARDHPAFPVPPTPTAHVQAIFRDEDDVATILETRARAEVYEDNERLRTVLDYDDANDLAHVTGLPSGARLDSLEQTILRATSTYEATLASMIASTEDREKRAEARDEARAQQLREEIRGVHVAIGGDLITIQRDCRQLRMDLIRANERTDSLAASLGLAPPIVTAESNAVASSQEEAARWDAENLQRAMTPAPYPASGRPPPLGSRSHLPSTPAMPDSRRATMYGGATSSGRLSLLPRPAPGASPPPPAPSPRPAFEGGDRPPSSIGREWFPKGTVKSFTGYFVVGSSCPSSNPIRWAKMAKEELENRGIPEHAWVKTVKSCLSPEVLDSFRTAFCSGNRTSAVAIRLLPHKRQQAYDPFEYTEWDEFCDWLLKEYVTSAHLEALQQYIDEVPCKGASAVREYVDVFNESCIYADYLSAFLGDPRMDGDMASALENIDTPHRRARFRKHLPPRIESKLAAFEGTQRAQQPGWQWTLSLLQEHASAASDVIREAGVRQGTAQLNHIQEQAQTHELPDGPLPPSNDLASVLSAQLHLMRDIHAQLNTQRTSHHPQAAAPRLLDHDGEDQEALDLHIKIADIMPNPPSAELIQQRLADRACLACGEKGTHTKFLECPRLLAMKDVADRIDAAVAQRSARPRPASRAPGSRNARVHNLDDEEDEGEE